MSQLLIFHMFYAYSDEIPRKINFSFFQFFFKKKKTKYPHTGSKFFSQKKCRAGVLTVTNDFLLLLHKINDEDLDSTYYTFL